MLTKISEVFETLLKAFTEAPEVSDVKPSNHLTSSAPEPSMFLRNAVFAFFFLGILALLGLMMWQFITSIIFAGILAGTFLPVNRFLKSRLRIPAGVSAILVCGMIILLVVIPSIYIVAHLANEVRQVYLYTRDSLSEEVLINFMFGQSEVAKLGREIFAYVGIEYSYETIRDYVFEAGQAVSLAVLNRLNEILSDVLVFSFQFVMMMLFIFSILLYGSHLKRFLFDLSPLPEEDEQLLIDRFNQMNYVTLVTNGLGGVLQGVLAGGAMWLVGFSSVLLWTVMMVVLAFIPLIGISFVYIPATIYLIAVGEYVSAVFFFLWCSAVAFLTENWFKPMWVGNRIKISSMAVLFSIIGGMAVFGTAGIFYGPLVLTLFLTFVDLYHARYVPRLEEGGE